MVQRLGTPAIQQQTVLEVQWSDCPDDVYEEISRKLWRDMEFGNDHYYYNWSGDEDLSDLYPVTAAYLAANNVEKCLIHFWW